MVPRKNIKATTKALSATPLRKAVTKRCIQSELNKRRGITNTPDDEEDDESMSTQSSQTSQSSSSSSSQSSTKPKIDVTTRQTIQIPRTENISPSKKSAATGKELDIIYIEVHSVNNEPFDGQLTKVEAKGIWEALDQDLSDIRRITIDRSKFVKIGFELKHPIKLTQISNKQNFNVEFTRGNITDIYRIKLTDYDKLAYKVVILPLSPSRTLALK